MRKSWKNFKYKLHGYFKEIGGEEELEMAKRRRHPDLKDDRQQDWEMLCDRWFSDEFKVIIFFLVIIILFVLLLLFCFSGKIIEEYC